MTVSPPCPVIGSERWIRWLVRLLRAADSVSSPSAQSGGFGVQSVLSLHRLRARARAPVELKNTERGILYNNTFRLPGLTHDL